MSAKISNSVTEALTTLKHLPQDNNGPIFAEPWQAQAFAMAVSLNERGVFTWSEWVEHFSAEIKQDGNPESYFDNWLETLEKILKLKGVVHDEERLERHDAWARASRATPHGEPIVLGRDLDTE